MTLVVGTAGHIDHGKTTLLRALTGIDADRLPEERRRGMTIDVGYAHLDLDDGGAIDFVDVPGHDRLVGNMLVGAGEIDAALLVVAADDGPRAQTLEHVALLDALGVASGLAVVTKIDAVQPDRVAEVLEQVDRLLATTALAGAPVLAASAVSGEGLEAVRTALVTLRERIPEPGSRPPTLAIDRVFAVKGRGTVVTGTLRGGPLAVGDSLRVVPTTVDHAAVRIREIQVHGQSVDRVLTGGRTALNLAGIETAALHRGMVLSADPDVAATDRVLAVFHDHPAAARRLVADRTRGRLHVGTASVDAAVGRSGRDALTLLDGRAAGIVRLGERLALRWGDRFVLRRGSAMAPIGGVVVDPSPPRGISRRRQSLDRVAALAAGDADARLDLHGAIQVGAAIALAPDVRSLGGAAAEAVAHDVAEAGGHVPITAVRAATAAVLRRAVTLRRDAAAAAAAAVVDEVIADGRLVRDGDLVRIPGWVAPAPDPRRSAAMDRLEAKLAVPAPPPLADAAREVECPPEGIRELERTGRIVVLEPGLAWAAATYAELAARAVRMATDAPLTPADFRDATGTSRKFVMAILEDLDRRAILRRTPAGHVPGPRAAR